MKRESALDLLTAHSVLPYWQRVWPQEELPYRLLTEAETTLRGRVDVDQALEDTRAGARQAWRLQDTITSPAGGMRRAGGYRCGLSIYTLLPHTRERGL